jgi:hypothetical protein
MRQQDQIQEGQRYAKVSGRTGFRSGWEVRSIVVPVESLPHAYMVNLADPKDVRTISCRTIADSQFFKLMGQSQPGGFWSNNHWSNGPAGEVGDH